MGALLYFFTKKRGFGLQSHEKALLVGLSVAFTDGLISYMTIVFFAPLEI